MARWDSYYPHYEPSRRVTTDQGIKARSQRGQFGQSWWAKRWIAALEALIEARRLSRGRSYARSGQVLSLEEASQGIEARVQGSRPRPYQVHIRLAPLGEREWEQVLDEMAAQAA